MSLAVLLFRLVSSRAACAGGGIPSRGAPPNRSCHGCLRMGLECQASEKQAEQKAEPTAEADEIWAAAAKAAN